MAQLMALLSGDGAAAGALFDIVRRADQASTGSNLLQGPRSRFMTATAVPLVERLNQALRQLLADGRLPLNRDGGAGWVSANAVWFVAKRLADTVREEILRSDPDATDSVPAPTRTTACSMHGRTTRCSSVIPRQGRRSGMCASTAPTTVTSSRC